jgi:uncharacterized OB-fold protein
MRTGGKDMGAFAIIRERFARIKSNLTSLDSQPISKAALIILLFLDIFILVAIFNGLDQHTRQLSSPDDYIPSACRDIVINRDWNPTNRIDNLSGVILSYTRSYYPAPENKKDHHPICAPYLDLLDRIKIDKELSSVFEDRNRRLNETRDLRREIESLKGAYDTSLLETIAKQTEGRAHVEKIKKDVREKTNALDTLKGEIETLERKINGNASVGALWQKLQTLQPEDREKLKADLRTLIFWYPVKRLAMQMVFLIPLFVIFYLWNNASLRKSLGVQVLVSSHLLVVSFIPIFFKIIETIYDIIPKKLLKKIIDLLESLKLIAIWHYLVIALAVAAALFLIYIFQKKLFSHEKLMERRISRGQCQNCGKHLPAGSQACPFCGFAQFKNCPECAKQTHVYGKYCRECGRLVV